MGGAKLEPATWARVGFETSGRLLFWRRQLSGRRSSSGLDGGGGGGRGERDRSGPGRGGMSNGTHLIWSIVTESKTETANSSVSQRIECGTDPCSK